MKKVIEFNRRLRQAMTQLKNHKLMHKIGKQWVVIGVSALVLSLGGVALSSPTHAADVQGNKAAVKVQPKLQSRAKALHTQIIRRADQNQNGDYSIQSVRSEIKTAHRTYGMQAAHANENAGLVIIRNSRKSNRRRPVKRNRRARRGKRSTRRPRIRRNRGRRAGRISYVSAYTYRSYQRQIRNLQRQTRRGTRYARRVARRSLARWQRQFKNLRVRKTVNRRRTKRIRRQRVRKPTVKKNRRRTRRTRKPTKRSQDHKVRKNHKARKNNQSSTPNNKGSFTISPSDNQQSSDQNNNQSNQSFNVTPTDQNNNAQPSDTNNSTTPSDNNMKLPSNAYTSDEISRIQAIRQRYNYLENHENSTKVNTDSDLANYRQHAIDWVNFYRTQLYDLQPVSENSDFDSKAQEGAESNTDPEDMILGDPSDAASAPSDVDIYFTDTDDADHDGTPGHRVSVLNPRSSNIGVGVDGGRDTLYFDFGLNNNVTSDDNDTLTYPNTGVFPLDYANQGNEDYWGASFITGRLNANSYPSNYQHILIDNPQVTVHDDTGNSNVNVSDVHNDGSLMNNDISSYNSAVYYKVDVNQLKANHQYTITITGDNVPGGSYSYSTKLFQLNNDNN